MKLLRLIVPIITGIIIGYTIGRFVPPSEHFVYVLLTNNSSVSIGSVLLRSNNEGYLLEDLPIGTSKVLKVYVLGESSYTIEVKFSNGKTLHGGAGYVESGYRVNELITDDKIESRIDLKKIF